MGNNKRIYSVSIIFYSLIFLHLFKIKTATGVNYGKCTLTVYPFPNFYLRITKS